MAELNKKQLNKITEKIQEALNIENLVFTYEFFAYNSQNIATQCNIKFADNIKVGFSYRFNIIDVIVTVQRLSGYGSSSFPIGSYNIKTDKFTKVS